MPGQLLSPAAMLSGPPAPRGTTTAAAGAGSPAGHASSAFLAGHDRRALRFPSSSRRPPIRRTASTQSIDEGALPREYADFDPADLSSDEGETMQVEPAGDPFVTTPPQASSSSSAASRSRGSLMQVSPSDRTMAMADQDGMDSPSSSPTLISAQNRKRRLPPSSAAGPSTAAGLHAPAKRGRRVSQEERDDAANNPFLAAPAAGPPKAPRKGKPTNGQKVSYVFRGKRITYDAPLEALFPADSDDEDAGLALKSGPRVLFPAPEPAPAPAPSMFVTPARRRTSAPTSDAMQVSPERPGGTGPSGSFLMQTPRRQPGATSTSNPTVDVLAGPTASSGAIAAAAAGKHDPAARKHDPAGPNRAIPPTPASLPQKTKEQRQVERERLVGATRAFQAVQHAQAPGGRRQGGAGWTLR